VFDGAIAVEEADALHAWLMSGGIRRIDLSRCTHLHPASLQVLLSAGAPIAAMPADRDLAAWIAPLFPVT
jgi:hypothetical protein